MDKIGKAVSALKKTEEWLYRNKLWISFLCGAVNSIDTALDLYPYIGSDCEISGATIKNFSETDFIVYSTLAFLQVSIIPYFVLVTNRSLGGLRIHAKLLQQLFTKDPAQQQKLLEEASNMKTYRMYKIDLVNFELQKPEPNMSVAADYLRRAIDDTVKTHYTTENGRIKHTHHFYRKLELPGYERPFLRKTFRKKFPVYVSTSSKGNSLETLIKEFSDMFGELKPSDIELVKNLKIFEQLITIDEEIFYGRVEKAEKLSKSLCHAFDDIRAHLIHAGILTALGHWDDEYMIKAEKQWQRVLGKIISDPKLEEKFNRITGSKNQVLEFKDNPTSKNMLIVKRGAGQELVREYGIIQFLYSVMEETGITPKALAFSELEGTYYSFQERRAGPTIEAVLRSSEILRYVTAESLLQALEQYQRKAYQKRQSCRAYGFTLEVMDYNSEFHEKFIKRLDAQLECHDFSVIERAMQSVIECLEEQRIGCCHGDFHYRNQILYGENKVCIIDPEKMFIGARILDWAHFWLHTKVYGCMDLEFMEDMGYDSFRKRRMSKQEYLKAWHSAVFFKAAHLTGTALKYSSPATKEVSDAYLEGYLGEAICSSLALEELIEAGKRQQIKMVTTELSTIRERLLS